MLVENLYGITIDVVIDCAYEDDLCGAEDDNDGEKAQREQYHPCNGVYKPSQYK